MTDDDTPSTSDRKRAASKEGDLSDEQPPYTITVDEEQALDREAIREKMDRRRTSEPSDAMDPWTVVWWALVLTTSLALLIWVTLHAV